MFVSVAVERVDRDCVSAVSVAEITQPAIAANPRHSLSPEAHPHASVKGGDDGIHTGLAKRGSDGNPSPAVRLQLVESCNCSGEDVAIAITRQTPDGIVVQPLRPGPGAPLGASHPTRQAGARESQPDGTLAILEYSVHAPEQSVLLSNGQRLLPCPQSHAVGTGQPQAAFAIQQHLPVLLRRGWRVEPQSEAICARL